MRVTRNYYCRLLYIFAGILFAAAVVPDSSSAAGEKVSLLKGIVSDVEGEAVEGAMIFIYNSPDVRRTADFISPPTDHSGQYRIELPWGKYWVVARLKKAEEYGPLMPGDKHSGDPAEIEIETESDIEMDFTVADLKEAIRMKRDSMDRPYKVSGRISDKKGAPVPDMYAVANRGRDVGRIPDYLSTWVDSEGRFTLYLPEGTYYFGAAKEFPHDTITFLNEEMEIDADRSDIAIVVEIDDDK